MSLGAQAGQQLAGRHIHLAPHRVFPLDDKVAVVARDSTGWSLLSAEEYQVLSRRFAPPGVQFDSLWAAEQPVAQALWDAGLLQDTRGRTAAKTANGSAKEVFPSSLLLKLTGTCNFACTYCYDFDETRFRQTLDLTRVREVIEFLLSKRDHLAITFHGGEPLLRFRQLKEIVSLALEVSGDRNRLAFSIQTNGSRMSDAVVSFLEEHHFSVGLSIDGNSDAANALRPVRSGPSAWSVVESLITRHERFVRDRCGFLMVVSKVSAPHVIPFARWLQERRFGSLGFSFLDSEGAGRGLDELRLSADEVVEFWRDIIEQIRSGEIKQLALTALISRIKNLFTLAPKDFCHKGPCGAASEFLVLDAAGAFRTCDCVYHPFFEAGGPNTPVGEMIANINPSRERVVQRHRWLRDKGPSCASCALFGLCGGTCPAKALASNGSELAVDAGECATSQYIYPMLLAEFASHRRPLLDYFEFHTAAKAED